MANLIFELGKKYITIDGHKTIVECTQTAGSNHSLFSGMVLSTNNTNINPATDKPFVKVGDGRNNWSKVNFIEYNGEIPDPNDDPTDDPNDTDDPQPTVKPCNNGYTITAESPLLRPGMTIETTVSENYVVSTVEKMMNMIREINS